MSVCTGSSSPTRRRGAALALALALGLLSACGSSDAGATSAGSSSADGSSGPAGTSGAAPAQAQALTVTEKDFRIKLESTDLAAGQYTITIDNQDQATHDLAVERDGTTIARSETVQPGQSGTLTVTLEAGSYVFYCGVGAHRANGMAVDVNVS